MPELNFVLPKIFFHLGQLPDTYIFFFVLSRLLEKFVKKYGRVYRVNVFIFSINCAMRELQIALCCVLCSKEGFNV